MIYQQLSGFVSWQTVISLLGLCGAGLGIRTVLKYDTRISIVERDSAKALAATERHGTDLAVTQNRVTGVETAIVEINSRLKQVDLLPGVNAKLEAIQQSIDKMLPRTEHEQELRQVEALAEEVRETRRLAQEALSKADTAVVKADTALGKSKT
jgi:hypothetical protein